MIRSLKTSLTMLTSIDVKFIFDSACLSASLGDERFLSSANILQIADVVGRAKVCLFLPCETSKKFRHFVSLPKQLNLVPRFSRLTVQ